MIEDVVDVHCPLCGERAEVVVDLSGGRNQKFTQDCPVCCNPWVVTVNIVKGRPVVHIVPE